MADTLAKFEYQRIQLVASLHAVADSLRHCAEIADNFASIAEDPSFRNASLDLKKSKSSSSDKPLINGPDVAPDLERDSTPTIQNPNPKKRKVAASQQEPIEAGAKRSRKTKPKDPNAPKRPASSYLIFQNQIRRDLKQKHPNITNAELLAMISKEWQSMDENDKQVYVSAMADAQERYNLDKKAYESRTPEEIAAANAAAAAAEASKKAKPRARGTKTHVTAESSVVPKPTVIPAPSSSSSSSSEDSDTEQSEANQVHREVDEDDDDDDEDSDEEEQEPAPKRVKAPKVTVPVTPAPKEKRSKKSKA